MKTIKKEYHIMAPRQKVWEALTDSKVIDKWGGGPAEMSSEVGFEFKLWGGDIYGKNIEAVPGEKLIQEWYGGNWEKPSIAEFRLTHKGGCTTLYLVHKGVPEKEIKSIDSGWDDYYLGRIKDLLEKNK